MTINGSGVRPVFRFEHFVLDPGRASLLANGCPVALRPKSFDVLDHLVENSGRLVSKDELIAAVWPGIVVSDESLAKCVSEARQALGDSGQRLIKTVPRRGYLFDGPVAAERGEAKAPAGSRSAAGRGRPWRYAALVAVLAAAMALVVGLVLPRLAPSHRPVAGRPSLAVLPFASLGDDRHDYLADGITEDLAVSLGRFSDLFVIGRNSALTVKNAQLPAAETGRRLGARYLVEGSLRRDGDRVRITAGLIEAASGRQLWAETYDRALTGVFAVEDEVSREIASRLAAHIARAELDRLRTAPPQTWAAYDYYLRGNALIENRRGEDRGAMAAEARGLFEKALAADPKYAPAIEGLAYSYAIGFLEPTRYAPFRREFMHPPVLERAASLGRQAIELDPYLAKAHATLAWILHWQYRRREALGVFERAIELNPNLVDGRYGLMLAHDGRAAEGVAFLNRIMRQDPFPPPIYFSYLGNAQFLAGLYEEARRTLQAGAEKLPDYRPIQLWLAAAAAQSGHLDEARAAAATALRLRPGFAIDRWLEHIRLAREADAARLADGARKAGLPD